MEWKQLFELLPGGPRGSAAIMIASAVGLLLYVSNAIPKDLFGQVLLATFVLSTSITITYPLEYGWKWIQKKYRQHSELKSIVDRLGKLTLEEKELVKEFLHSGTPLHYGRGYGVLILLERDKIITMLSKDECDSARDIYVLSEMAAKHLNAHLEIIYGDDF